MNCREFIQDHDLRMKEITVLGTLGRSKLQGYKTMELLKEFKTAEGWYAKGLVNKEAYMECLDRIIKVAKGIKLTEKQLQRQAEEWAYHNM